MIKNEWKFIGHNRLILVSVIVMTIIPFLYSIFFLKSVWDPYGNTQDLPVAVVNKDKAVKYNGETLNVGKETVKKLKKNKQLGWRFVSANEAKVGMKDKKYYTIITIPKDFSKNAATLMNKHPKKMVLNYKTNDSLNYIGEVISSVGVSGLDKQIRAAVTNAYASAMFDQLHVIGKGMGQAATGASQVNTGLVTLNNGLNQYTAGVSQVNDGVQTLSVSVSPLATGVQQLADGSNSLATGLGTYTAGVDTLADGISTLNGSTGTLASGVQQLADGGTQLQSGQQQLTANSSTLNSGSAQVADGLAQMAAQTLPLTSSVNQLTSGSMQLSNGLNQLETALSASNTPTQQAQITQLTTALPQINSGLQQLNQSLQGSSSTTNIAGGLTDNLTDIGNQAQTLGGYLTSAGQSLSSIQAAASGANTDTTSEASAITAQIVSALTNSGTQLSDADQTTVSTVIQQSLASQTANTSSDITSALQSIAADLQAAGTANRAIGTNLQAIQTAAPQLQQLSGQLTQLQTSVNQLATASNQALPGAVQAITQLNSGLASVQTALAGSGNQTGLTSGASQLSSGLTQLNGSVPTLTSGINQLSTGATQVNSGVQQYTGGVDQLGSGISQLTTGLSQLNSQVPTLVNGVSQLNDGGQTLKRNSSTLNSGATQLASGIGSMNAQIPTLISGVQTLSSGTSQLAANSADLTDGSQKLTDGSKSLKTALTTGAHEVNGIKTTSKTADMFAAPTKTKHSYYSRVSNYGHALAPYVLSVALYVGAIVFNFAYPIRKVSKTDGTAAQWFLSKVCVGAVVAVGMAVIEATFIIIAGLDVDHVVQFYLTAILFALTSMFLIMFLSMTFDNPGRFVAMVILMLQLGGSGGTFPMEVTNGFFNAIHPFLPMTYSINAFREAITSGLGSNTVFASWGTLLIFLAVSLGLLYYGMRILQKIHESNFMVPSQLDDNQKLQDLEK
ncbi:YhgE/Pip family protein [Agrilactobacillus yilanensis]|uniref:YhgE/Pip family protein n=1 Tax=Agrilactobacillus yilanensis TaxID=2485997 RepID=A0ABW4J8F0_9LACO|nr:YhgE/Pip domain-containing protein [Agrilactobacillus yilanensis]